MIFTELSLAGTFQIDIEPIHDERGFFGRSYCQQEFQAHNLDFDVAQCNVSYNHQAGTLRGMHYQIAPHEEAKLVRCVRGVIYDVIIDLRPSSLTFLQWISITLDADRYTMVYIPKGFAHGFQTLTDQTEVLYTMFNFFNPNAAKGIRYDDERFGIEWHLPITNISDKDRSYPDFDL